jgi:quaternary ammonium compound-resistance protein SugE
MKALLLKMLEVPMISLYGFGRVHRGIIGEARDLRTASPGRARVLRCAQHQSGESPQPGRNTMMAWVTLVVAGLFEIGWAIGLKYTEGFTRLWPTVWTVVSMIISLLLLGIAMKSLPVGTAYSVWVGVGAVGTVILGIALLGEPANAARLISVALIIGGIIGLKLATPA